MKHLLAASALFGMSVLTTACGTDVDPTDRAQSPTGNVTYTLYLYDAQTGAALTDATVNVQVGAGDPLVSSKVGGAFVVESVPTGTFAVTINADGYLPLTGVQQFSGSSVTSFQAPVFTVQYAPMYPTQSVTADQTIKVYDALSGAAIASGQVLATLPAVPTTIAPPPLGTGSATPFSGSYGFLPNVITAQISAGTATLPRDQLVFGGSYKLSLVGVQNTQGSYLNIDSAPTVQVGKSVNPTVVFATSQGVQPSVLLASNENATKVPAGTLTLNFPYPVETCTDKSTWTFTAASAPTAVTPVTTGDAVTVTTSGSGGTTLTIRPNSTADGSETSLTYTVTGIGIRLVGNSTCATLGGSTANGVLLRGGSPVSNIIYVR